MGLTRRAAAISGSDHSLLRQIKDTTYSIRLESDFSGVRPALSSHLKWFVGMVGRAGKSRAVQPSIHFVGTITIRSKGKATDLAKIDVPPTTAPEAVISIVGMGMTIEGDSETNVSLRIECATFEVEGRKDRNGSPPSLGFPHHGSRNVKVDRLDGPQMSSLLVRRRGQAFALVWAVSAIDIDHCWGAALQTGSDSP